MLHSMGLQRVGHDWVSELNWIFALSLLVLSPKFSSLKQQTLITCWFLWVTIQVQFSQVPRVSQSVSWRLGHLGLVWGICVWELSHVSVGSFRPPWLWARDITWASPQDSSQPSTWLPSEQMRPRKGEQPKMEATVSFNLISEVISCHFFHILSIGIHH